ncbi:sensor histidine kinase [Agromyces sp. MMS24-JH15]|uniref:sensor histidine kinase n=1 Tax=Agromyces sp. MMS24-JH15 TaxID=3243765 RepID=UPI003749D103
MSRAQVEAIASRSLGVLAVVFGLQVLPIATAQSAAMGDGAGAALMAVIYGAAVGLAVAAAAKVAVRTISGMFAAVYLAALVAWPFLVADPAALDGGAPWLYGLCTVATAAAAIAFPAAWAAGYTILAPTVYLGIRTMPAGGDATVLQATLESLYALILGAVVLVIVTMLRHAARQLDDAQETALQRYDHAARRAANEAERVRTDALVHDSVLTTLLSAAAATTPDQQALAARMARDALDRLRDVVQTAAESDRQVPLAVLVRRLREAIATFASPFEVEAFDEVDVELGVEAIDALYSAAVQAMVNSLQHAADGDRAIRRSLRVRGVRGDACVIEVEDDGIGFDPAAVPSERLGLRVSIEDRMRGSGGSALIESRPGGGTRVVLAWPSGTVPG